MTTGFGGDETEMKEMKEYKKIGLLSRLNLNALSGLICSRLGLGWRLPASLSGRLAVGCPSKQVAASELR